MLDRSWFERRRGASLEFSILGPLEVRADGQAIGTGTSKEWALLALLLLNADRVVPVARLVDELWGERVPGSARKMVQISVSQLRKQLPAGLIQTKAPGYRLNLGEHGLDLRRFEQLAARGREALRSGRAMQAADMLGEALELWRGTALAEFSEPFAAVERARLAERELACLEDRIDADLALGRHHEIVADLEALVHRQALRERPRSQLMLALYRAGRHAEALDAYQAFRRLLAEELGIEPSEALKDLERRILRQDASLSLPAPMTPVCDATGLPAPEPLVSAVAERPVGRDAELSLLEQRLAEARGGQRSVVFVTGEAGIGKTTIVESFVATVSGAEFLIGHGQCVEHRGAGEPYLPVLDALGRLCRQPGGDAVVQVLARVAPTWLAQLPSLVADDVHEALERRLAGATHERMLRELLDGLDDLASRWTLVLVLEDLHWSDPSTLDLLDALAHRREAARLLVLGTYRRADALARPQSVYELEQTLRPRGLCTEIAVGALNQEALEAYVARRFSVGVSPVAVARLLRERAGGKPLFAKMLFESWLERGLVARDGAPIDADVLAADIPDGVRELIEQLRRRLSSDDAALLGAASLVGRRFSAAAAAAALESDEDAVEARCEALARTGVFLDPAGTEEWPDGTVASRYAFGHDLQTEVLYDLLPAGQRARMHRRVGRRLEAAFATDGSAAALLASHFVRAHDAAKAVPHLARAGEQALRQNAHREAVAHLTEALRQLERLPPSRNRDEQELALLTRLGPAQITLGGYASPDAAETYDRARAASTRLGDGTYLLPVLYGLWNNAIVGGRHDEALAVGEDFLRLATELDDAAMSVACRAVGLPLFFLGRLEEARACLERAVAAPVENVRALLDRYGEDPRMAGRVTLSWQLWLLGYPERAARASAAAVEEARALDHPFSLVYALMCATLLHHFRRDVAATRRHAEETAALARAHDIALFAMWATIPLQWACALDGTPDGDTELMRRSMEAAADVGALVFRPYWLSLAAEVEANAGEVEAALATVGEALEAAAGNGERFWEAELHRQRGELELRRGDAEAAAAAFARAAEVARRQGALTLELRAAMSATALPEATDSARAALADAYAAFEEGHDSADLIAAREALGAASLG
jgi:DNA-binding SARP family transcriptional activator/predicted ATPase